MKDLPPLEFARDLQHILIVGAGDTGVELARRVPGGWDITIVDVDVARARSCAVEPERGKSVTLFEGDATSRLVLEKAGARNLDAAVVATSPDDVSLEVGRLLKDVFAVPRVWVLVRKTENDLKFADLDVELIHNHESSAAMLASKITRGIRLVPGIGQQRGDIMETDILSNSSVIGKSLKSFEPKEWLIALIYRGDRMIIPHGDTILQAGDRLIVTGEPRILPSICRFLRSGHSEFPLHYGTGIVAPLGSETFDMLREISYLMENTRAEFLDLVTCGSESPYRKEMEQTQEQLNYDIKLSFISEERKDDLRCWESGRDVGLLIQPPEPMSLFAQWGITKSPLIKRLKDVHSPVLIPRGTFPYKRILFAINDYKFSAETTTLAVDIARILSAELTAAIAMPPEIVSGPEMLDQMRRILEEVRDLASAYGMRINGKQLHGNPIHSLLLEAKDYDLVVVGYRKDKRRNLMRPGVESHLLHRSGCSVLLLPHEGI